MEEQIHSPSSVAIWPSRCCSCLLPTYQRPSTSPRIRQCRLLRLVFREMREPAATLSSTRRLSFSLRLSSHLEASPVPYFFTCFFFLSRSYSVFLINLQPDAADGGRLIYAIHLGGEEGLLKKKNLIGWEMNESPIYRLLKLASQIFDIDLQGVTDADPSVILPAAARIHTTHSCFFFSFLLVSPCGCEGSFHQLRETERETNTDVETL